MKLIKKAVEIGNGAAVYIPKEYEGKEVIIFIPEGVKEIKKRVLISLINFMPNIIGMYLYGSYARNEQSTESDVDILVITKDKDENINNTLKDIDARVVPIEDVKRTIKEYPLLIIPILKEAETLLNQNLLDELKKHEVDFKKLKWNFDDINRILKIIEGFIDLDDKDISSSHIYSLIMRVRVCYLIECLLKDKKFSNKAVKDLLLDYGLKKDLIEEYFDIYRKIRLKKGIESLKKQIEIHREKLKNAMKDGNEELTRYYEKDLERLEKEEKKKDEQFNR